MPVVRSLVVATALLGPAAALAYTYDRGPNWVNLSATSCHAARGSDELKILRAPGEAKTSSSGAPYVTYFCPINRRNTTFYSAYKQAPSTPNREVRVNIQSIQIRAQDAGSGSISCWAFGTSKNTNATLLGAAKFFCSTVGGCSGESATYVGTNTVSINFPFPTTPMVSYGFACNVPPDSKLFYSETWIDPNP
jgi:hypothetical protein